MTTHAEPRLARRLDMDDQAVLFPVLAEEAPIADAVRGAEAMDEERAPADHAVGPACPCLRTISIAVSSDCS